MRRSLYFTRPHQVEVREEDIPRPGKGEVSVRTRVSGISAGTEMLFYRNEVDRGTKLDTSISSLGGSSVYPFKYGYAVVGEVVEVGEGALPGLVGSTVFCFHSHESHFTAPIQDVIAVPREVYEEDALFLPSMETALSLVMDAAPRIGEDVVVLGQGVIGLLTTALLAMMPLSSLTTADRYPLRRERSLELGAGASLDPSQPPEDLRRAARLEERRADLVLELSGDPKALEYATHLVGMEGRILVGSWYGNKEAVMSFGEDFHRNRVTIMSSQVSRVAGALFPRWPKTRRLEYAWRLIMRTRPSRLITHRFPIERAEQAYDLLDRRGGEAIQVILTYGEG
jgi:2-desacetyl-2-hydroxyethyl bacteriochlorophyllide A dehydrogenase